MKTSLLIGLLFSLNTFAANMSSIYTSIKRSDCVSVYDSTKDPHAEIDSEIRRCVGLAGFETIISGGDLRYDLSLSYGGQEVVLAGHGPFRDIEADKIEWRYEKTGSGISSQVTFKALIYRLAYQGWNEKTEEPFQTEKLVVVKLDGLKSCVVGKVEKQNQMNKKARAIADKADELSCQ